MYRIALGLAGGSLILSATILYVVLARRSSPALSALRVLRRTQILREQQERLHFLGEERRMQDEEWEWRRSMMDGEDGPLELSAPAESNGHSEAKQSKLRSQLRHVSEG